MESLRGAFAYTSTSGYVPALGPDGRYQLPRDKVTFGRTLSEDEIDFDSGFLIMPPAIPEALRLPLFQNHLIQQFTMAL